MIAARRAFIDVVGRVVPEFFKRLRDRLPMYAKLVGPTEPDADQFSAASVSQIEAALTEASANPGNSSAGVAAYRQARMAQRIDKSTAAVGTWSGASEDVRQLVTDWAREFNAEQQEWILRGGLAMLENWREKVYATDDLTPHAFYVALGRLHGGGSRHQFELRLSWAPEAEKWGRFKKRVEQHLAALLAEYEHGVRAAAGGNGLQRARKSYKADHLEWFAMMKLRGMSSMEVLNRVDATGAGAGDASVILKGAATAAALLGWREPEN